MCASVSLYLLEIQNVHSSFPKIIMVLSDLYILLPSCILLLYLSSMYDNFQSQYY